MPTTHHTESHFAHSDKIRDVVIGMADGLTVPFALAAGLSGAAIHSDIIVTAGLAEIAAGAIAMGLGGYLAAQTDLAHYISEYRREEYEIEHMTKHEKHETMEILENFGLEKSEAEKVVEGLAQRPKDWADFMMKFELGLDRPDPKRARRSGATIALSYIIGGLVPLMPYMMGLLPAQAFSMSIVTTSLALLSFGAMKGYFTGISKIKSGLQTLLIGGLAAGAAYQIASWIGT